MTTCDAPAAARLADARKRYGQVEALAGLDLAIAPGEVLALLGANGAGKSTAIALLLGLARADGGQVALFGKPPHCLPVRRRIGVMLQSAALPETSTVGELLEATRACYPHPRTVADCVALAGLDGLLARRYGKLSGGQQRRVQFALAMCGAPDLLFLDEPTTGLDIDARRLIWQAIRELRGNGAAVLLTTHYLEEAEALADRVLVIDRGRAVACGSVDDIRARVARQRIRCRSALDAATLAAQPGVFAAERAGDWLSLDVDDALRVLPALLADTTLADLEISRAGLADAFLALTTADKAQTSESPISEAHVA